MGTLCRGGTGGPSRGRRGRGGEGRGIFLDAGVGLGVTGVRGGRGGEQEEVAVGAELMEGEEEVVEGKKACRSQRGRP